MLRSASILALAALSTTRADQVANFNVTQATAASFGCGDACFEVLQSTVAYDREYVGADFDTEFYATAANFSTAKPGDLLKFQALDPANLTTLSGVSAYRFQYVSEDYDATLVPVSGFIALPNSLPASGKFPLIAFAHGTIGTSFGCAISNGPDFFDYDSWSLLTARGYAVVATDYAGLGNNATYHKYCTHTVHAKDLFHSVVAARQALGSVLTPEWASVGHSQGGGAVWKLAEDVDSLAEAHNSSEADNYLGTVALAPAAKVWDLFKYAVNNILPRDDFLNFAISELLPMTPYIIKPLYPDFNSSMLGDIVKKRLGLVDEAQLCAGGVMGLVLDLTVEELTTFTTTGATDRDIYYAEAYQNATAPGNGAKAHGPVLVVQGVNDTAVLADVTEQVYESACAGGSEIHLLLYPKQDHSGVITAAAPEWLRWVDSQFDSTRREVTATGECTKVTKQPFDYEYVKAEPEIDLSTNSLN